MEISEYYRVSVAAEHCDVRRSTLLSAIERGELPAKALGCGLPIVRLADVEVWKAQPRQPGPKPKKKPKAAKRRRKG